LLISTSDAATKHKHKHHKADKAPASAKAATTTKAGTTTTTAKVSSTASTAIIIPSAAHGVLFGTSFGGNMAGTIKMFPNARVGRYFWPGAPSAKLPALPSTWQIWLSFNVSPATVASGRYNAQFATILQAWNKSGRTVYWNWEHEYDRSSTSAAALFRAGWAQLLSVERRYPSTRVKSMNILTGIVLAPNKPHGDPSLWYVNTDILGFDCYVPASVPRAMAYAKAKHKPWTIPEFGANDGDAGNVTYIKSTIASWAAFPPLGAAWYNNTAGAGFSQPLTRLPQTVAFLKALAAAG
jgi:hypothetical protein